ncbi:MFS transporter [Streptomyces ferrugineus]|uniref:MFS transporter n=1 Tax=Streptomyces ferrugineus TaxID=1413221 RepID=A0A7M2SMX4_9ACTN|nr:MFS transporter [Streptomyces ferrugineus]QOV37339.1 MFS transporter [Streptomyces ferrugineus]
MGERAGFRVLFAPGPFRRFFASRAISLLGDAVVPTALALAMTELGYSAGWLGAILAAAILPKVVFLVFGGIAADRMAKRPLMVASSIVCGTAQITTVAVLVSGAGIWWALVCQGIYGVSVAAGHPATFGYLPHCVSPRHLGAANALMGAWTGGAALLGPAITAACFALGDAAWALAFDGVSFLLAAALLWGLPRGAAVGADADRVGVSALQDGWRAMQKLPWLLRMTAVDSSILLLVSAPFMVLGPALVSQRMSANSWALLMLLFAAGELVGSLVSGKLSLPRPILVAALSLLAMGLPPMFLAAGAGLASLSVAQVLAGASVGIYGVLVTTAVQQAVPREHLSKVGALSSVGSFAFLPLGYVMAPLIAALTGPTPLLWAAAAWTVVSVAALASDQRLRRFHSPKGALTH